MNIDTRSCGDKGKLVLGMAAIVAIIMAVDVRAEVKPVSERTGLNTETAKRWANPEIFEVNREPAHAAMLLFPDEKSALPEPEWNNPYAASDRYLMLNGTWKFRWSKNPDSAPKAFFKTGFDRSDWKDISVPLPWQLADYGQIYYFNATQPFHVDPRNSDRPKDKEERKTMAAQCWIPTEYNPVGSYCRTFTVPANWKDMKVVLHFGGVQSAFTCWVNGKEVGYSQDSFSPAEFDISTYLKPGRNTLAVQVIRWSDGAYMENQDMIRLSGIIRDVMLVARPMLNIQDFQLQPTLDASLKKGVIHTELKLYNGSGEASVRSTVELTLFNQFGKQVLKSETAAESIPSGRSQTITFNKLDLENPDLWHPETPHLYTALLTLKSDGKVLETIRQDVGFRALTWDKNGNMFLNGKRFYFRGVNYHDTNPETGVTIDYQQMSEDIRLMKQLNINTVRNGHYPRDRRWYALCARYGVVVLDECNIETHTLEVIMDDAHPEWRAQALFRMRNMVMRMRNEPAVLIWSLGNEQFNGWPQTVQAQAELTRELDPSRGIMAERAWYKKTGVLSGQGYIDFVTPMYGRVAVMKKFLEEHWEKGDRRPFFFCEYSHCMGNSCNFLIDQWSFMEEHEGFNGGCIWDWADQSLLRPLPGLEGRHYTYGGDWGGSDEGRHYTYAGDWGGSDSDTMFCMNGVVLPNRKMTGKSYEVKAVYQQVAVEAVKDRPEVLLIKNKFAFRNLNEFDVTWELLENGHPVKTGRMELNVEPLSEKTMLLPCGAIQPKPGGSYHLNIDMAMREQTAWCESGHIIASAQIELPVNGAAAKELLLPADQVDVIQDDNMISVVVGSVAYRFDTSDAALSQISIGGKQLLAPGGDLTGLELNLNCNRTDDQLLFAPPESMKASLEDGINKLRRQPVSLECTQTTEHAACITAVVDYLLPEKSDGIRHTARYTVLSNGRIQVDNDLEKMKLSDDAALFRVGVRLPVAKAFSKADYAGLGPHANYEARLVSGRYGHYALEAGEFYEHFVRPQECGNRSMLDWISLRDESGDGLAIVGAAPGNGSVMPWSREEMDGVTHEPYLPSSQRWILRYDARMGVLPEHNYIHFKEQMSFRYSIRPIHNGMQLQDAVSPR